MQITPLSPVLAAEVHGLDLNLPIDAAAFAALGEAFDRHGVLVFRDQDLAPAAQVAFSRRFGPLEVHIQKRFHHPAFPEILIVSNVLEEGRPIGLADAGRYWHSDLSYLAEPSFASVLNARELPPGDGDTLFAGLKAAYDGLDAATKQHIAGLTAIHDYDARNKLQAAKSSLRPALSAAEAATVPPVAHPIVRRHADGRAGLFVSEGFTTRIPELPEDEGRALLAALFQHSTEERFLYRHRWLDGDVVMWDNRATLHLATGCRPGARRTLYRTTIRGPVPLAA
jgi:taurine dioxygenase